ncbi:MAG: LysE family translocator [Candidatus Rokubacteria bacterium]|nr:LysE family translocator [Candidatus Rokubacteria bacterium]
MMLVLRSVMARGRRAGLLTTLGICSGLFVHATLSALGLSLLLVRSASLFHAVKLAGAAYLIWLGIQSLCHAWRIGDGISATVSASASRPSGRRALAEGFVTNVLNPKVAVFYLAFLPQFVNPGEWVFGKSMLLAAIHCGEGLVWLTAVTLGLDRVRGWIVRPRVRRGIEVVAGAVLIGFGARLAMEHARQEETPTISR